MSSTPSVTISLNTTGVSTPLKPSQTNDSGQPESSAEPSEFGGMVERAASPKDGKPLPQERDVSSADAKSIQVNLNDLSTRTEGRLKLVTGDQAITEDDLVAFMQEQGFSRSEIAELLMAQDAHSKNVFTETNLTANEWFHTPNFPAPLTNKLAEANKLSEAHKLSNDMAASLADAISQQLLEPKEPEMISPIVSVIASKEMLSKLIGIEVVVETNSSEQAPSKTLDLASLLSRSDASQMSLTGQNAGQESSGQLERFDKAVGEMVQTGQKTQDFREFLAEHLRRADSLKELSERLGTFLAKQMSAQIGRGIWRLEMALHPAELGSIEVDMEMTERGLEASFKATQSVTRDLLMESMSRLKSWFEEGGIDVAYAGLTQDSGAETGGNSTSDDDSLDPGVDSMDDETSNVSETEQHEVQGTERLDIRV